MTSQGAGGCRVYLPTRETAEHAAMEEMRTNNEIQTMDIEPHTSAGTGETSVCGEKQEKPTIDTAIAGLSTTQVETTGMAEAAIPVRNAMRIASVPKRNAPKGENVTTDSNLDTTIDQLSANSSAIPTVAVSAVFNVPTKLMRIANVNIPTNVRDATTAESQMTTAIGDNARDVATDQPTINAWGRHGYIIAEIYKIIGSMEPPWGSQCVFEAAVRRFPDVDASALQMTVLVVLMTQRQCIRDLTLAGARRGPRRDENGQIFMELDLEYAHRYSDSY